MVSSNVALAQLPNGSTAPNWTMTDLNNNSHTLYTYLNNNKTVFLEFTATWCIYCWNYHNTNAFKNLYNQYGPPGTDKVMTFMIEADAATNVACLYDQPNCTGGGTWGNWVSGTPFPIFNNHTLNGPYAINYFPTLYAVCPSKKIYEVAQMPANDLYAVAQWCSAPDLFLNTLTHVKCHGNSTGAITVNTADGIPPFTFLWSNGATTQSISNLPAGNYTLTVTGSLGGTKTLGPITVNQPSAPLSLNVTNIQPQGCNGMGGIIEIEVNGGTPNYVYNWSNGANGPVNAGLNAGTYSVSITDANACTINQGNMVVAPPTYPIAVASSPTPLTCTTQFVTLNGTGTSTGQQFTYAWSTADGFIHSGANTLNNCIVTAAGTYNLLVTNTTNTCTAIATTVVTANQTPPLAVAGPPGTINCTNPQTTLNGVGPTGQNYNLLWTTVGGNIVSGATTLNPVVNAGGTYTLTITNTSNGCSGSSSTTVTANTAAPNISASGGVITCNNASVNLAGNSTTPGVSFAWTGPNSFSSSQQNPSVSTQGTYQLTVTNPANGCTATASAQVTLNTTAPQATAQGGVITCTNSNVSLSGSSTTQNVTYGWTGPNNFTSIEQNPTVNAVGNYVLTVTASNGCKTTATGVVSQNTTPPTANAGPSGILNCSANQVVLNGTSSSSGNQFSYNWTTQDGHIVSGATTLTPTVDSAGTYTLTVTNSNNGCTSSASTPVVQRQPVAATVASQTNVACFGNSTGSATALGSGGNGIFTYTWSNGANAATASNLSAGNYSVVVTDGENCTATKNVTITQPTVLTVNAATTAQTTPGTNDGTASANPQGGTGNYAYQWSNGETSQTITGLAPGNYTVSVTDQNGCQKTQTVTVNVFGCAVSANLDGQDASCFGSNDGAASVTLTNAAAPQTFNWSNGAQTANVSGLEPGTYSVTATDGNGCEVVASTEIGEPSPLNANTTATGLTGTGSNDGTATANPTGGTSPFTFIWSNGGTSQTITGLPSANYTVSVTDANGCVAVQTVPVAPFGCSTLANVTSSNISCFGETDGQATVTLTGGLTPFTYNWSNGENTATINNLAAGTYTASVTDAVNCPAIVEVTIAEPAQLELTLGEFGDTDCGANNGHATVMAEGGTPASNYSFFWSNGETGPSVSNLGAGSYTVSVIDGNDCEANLQVQIKINDTEPPLVLTQNLTISLGATGITTLDASQVDNGSSDNCSILEMSIDKTSFDCSDLGTNEITLTVVDEAGNTATSTATVEIVDNQPPVISVQNLTVSLDENGMASITAQMLDAGSTDNCGIAEQSIDLTNFTCQHLGQHAVVLTVKDASGNVATGTATVSVQDNIAPSITCPDDIVLAYCDPVTSFEIETSDNCTQNITPSLMAGLPSGSAFPTGTTIQTFEANDGNGNKSNCSFKVVVPAAMQVDISTNMVSCFGETDGSASASVTGGTQGYTYLWDNGATSQSIQNLSTGAVSVSITDGAGCVAVQSATVSQPAAITTTVVQVTPETSGQQNGSIDVTVAGGTTPYSYEWTDASGNVLGNQEDLGNIAAGNYTLKATDANGCVSLHAFTIQAVSSTVNHELERRILLFPNPTSGLVTLALDEIDAMEADIQVFDMTGKLTDIYRNADVSSGLFVMDMAGYADGIFLVRIMIENQIVVKRLVIQK